MHELGNYINESKSKRFLGIGSAWDVYSLEDSVKKPYKTVIIASNVYPAAAEIAQLAMKEYILHRTVAIEEAQPVYLRNNVAKKSKK